jgi:flagellar biosynthetic protein FliR
MITISALQIDAWISLYFWPFLRIGACLMTAPMFGATHVPRRTRLILAGAITILIAPLVASPQVQMFSGPGFAIVAQQMLIGIAMGFALQLVFDAVSIGGQLLANTMGLSFAVNVDPLHGASTPVLGQFYTIVATLTFVALNGHVMLLDVLVQSFGMLPIGAEGLSREGLWMIANFGTAVFSAALMVALPGLTALLIVNFGFGVMSRAAPTLNLFAVGFSAALAFGLVILLLGLPGMQATFIRELNHMWNLIAAMLGGS